MNSDYGKGKDAGKTIKYRITAENSNYGKKVEEIIVTKPETTYDNDKAKESQEEPPVRILLGRRPVLSAEMEYSDFIKRASKRSLN